MMPPPTAPLKAAEVAVGENNKSINTLKKKKKTPITERVDVAKYC